MAKRLTPAMSFSGLDMVKASELLLLESRIAALLAFTTSALHHSMSICCVCVCMRVHVCCLHSDILFHGYCWGFICVLGHVPECLHLHLGICNSHTHTSISSTVVLTVLCHA